MKDSAHHSRGNAASGPLTRWLEEEHADVGAAEGEDAYFGRWYWIGLALLFAVLAMLCEG